MCFRKDTYYVTTIGTTKSVVFRKKNNCKHLDLEKAIRQIDRTIKLLQYEYL